MTCDICYLQLLSPYLICYICCICYICYLQLLSPYLIALPPRALLLLRLQSLLPEA